MRSLCVGLLLVLSTAVLDSQEIKDPVQQAIAEGDFYQSKHRYDLAFESYRKADNLSNHSSAEAYLRLSILLRRYGNVRLAAEDAKRSFDLAGTNTKLAAEALFQRATLLSDAANNSGDKKLGESERCLRQALSLDPSNSLIRYELGFVLLKQRRDQEGIAELNNYLNGTGTDSRYAAEARRMISNPIRAREPLAPDFAILASNQQKLSSASLRGNVVLMVFWGAWCNPCRASVPNLRNLEQKYFGKPFEMIGISSDDDEEVWKTFISGEHLDWPQYLDRSREITDGFRVRTFPTYIVMDKDGVIRFRKEGWFPGYLMLSSHGVVSQPGMWIAFERELEEAINRELKRPPDPKLAAPGPTQSGQ